MTEAEKKRHVCICTRCGRQDEIVSINRPSMCEACSKKAAAEFWAVWEKARPRTGRKGRTTRTAPVFENPL